MNKQQREQQWKEINIIVKCRTGSSRGGILFNQQIEISPQLVDHIVANICTNLYEVLKFIIITDDDAKK